jgi:glycosyltransferase involved in cell wall biosynthesis
VDLSIVIPVFNEAASIPPLVDEVCDRLEGKPDYEIIAVDAGSSDATPDVSGIE